MSKKIIPIVSLSLIAVLVIAVIVMACIPKSYAPISAQPNSVCINQEGNQRVFEKSNSADKKIYDELYREYCKAFEESSINALFNGRIAKNPVVKYVEKAVKKDSLNNNSLRLNFYPMNQKVKVEKTEFVYKEVIIELDNTNVMSTVKAYLFDDSNETHYYIETIGNIDNLTNYVKNIK